MQVEPDDADFRLQGRGALAWKPEFGGIRRRIVTCKKTHVFVILLIKNYIIQISINNVEIIPKTTRNYNNWAKRPKSNVILHFEPKQRGSNPLASWTVHRPKGVRSPMEACMCAEGAGTGSLWLLLLLLSKAVALKDASREYKICVFTYKTLACKTHSCALVLLLYNYIFQNRKPPRMYTHGTTPVETTVQNVFNCFLAFLCKYWFKHNLHND